MPQKREYLGFDWGVAQGQAMNPDKPEDGPQDVTVVIMVDNGIAHNWVFPAEEAKKLGEALSGKKTDLIVPNGPVPEEQLKAAANPAQAAAQAAIDGLRQRS